MKNKKFLVAAIIFVLFSCNKKQNENNENQVNKQVVEKEAEAEAEAEKPNYKFEFMNIIKTKFIPCDETSTTYVLEFELKNNSNIPINTFYFDSAIEGVFEDGEELKQDGTFDHYSEIININSTWKPGEIKTFQINLPNVPYNYNFFKKQYFERTPKIVNITFTFKARGIDGEFEETQLYNLINEWKDYQTELGYR